MLLPSSVLFSGLYSLSEPRFGEFDSYTGNICINRFELFGVDLLRLDPGS
uniref:Uncharacterized protein n=1 Tax=Aegilops tauschii subsp. strangulata TaxID=200361 RepID=A0A453NSX5_AEGTS